MGLLKWFFLLGLVLTSFLNPYLPQAWVWENSPLEWLQVDILAAGMVLNYIWWKEIRSVNHQSTARFLAWTVPIWPLLIVRELSCGRVFYLRDFHPYHGPTYLSLTEFAYGWTVHPLFAVAIIAWLYGVIKYSLYKIPYKLFKKGRFPVAELAMTLFASVAATIGEKKLHLQTTEESYETFAYLGLILIAYGIKIALQKETLELIPEQKNANMPGLLPKIDTRHSRVNDG